MFPQITDVFNYLFGTNIHLPINSYGFFVALAFLTGAYILKLELKRKEKEGLLQSTTRKVLKGAPAGAFELIVMGVFGFVIGYKLGGIIADYAEFSDNPQTYIFSSKGNIAGAIILAIVLAVWRFFEKKKKQLAEPVWEDVEVHPFQLSGNILIIAAVAGLLGAKIFHNLENFQDLINDPVGSIFSFMGLTFYGGLIVGSITVIIYARKNKISVTHLIDGAAPAIMLSYGVGRMGCMMSGDGCWGVPNLSPKPGWLSWMPDWIWSFRFPHNVIGEGIGIDHCTGKYCTILEQPVYPTSFYDFALCVIFFFVLWMIRKKIKTPGMLFSIMLLIIGVQRFFMEKIRVNNVFDILGIHTTQAELISVFLILLGITGFIFFSKRNKRVTN